MPRGKRAPAVSDAERARQAAELKKSGATYSQIANVLGFRDADEAADAVLEELKRTVTGADGDADSLLDLTRLDDMQRALWARVISGDQRAIAAVLRIMDTRTRRTVDDDKRRQLVSHLYEILDGMWQSARAGDLQVQDRVLKIVDRIVQLEGFA